MKKFKPIAIASYGNALVLLSLATYFFIAPFLILVNDIRDPALHSNNIPQFSYRWHKQLSDKIEPWALNRIASDKAKDLTIDDISGTEWPMFTAVLYLMATESLQDNWQGNHASLQPKIYAQGSIKAAIELILDPNNASWVEQHWGADYLEKENVFYRMLLINGLVSYQKLSDDTQFQPILEAQVRNFAQEFDHSPYGLLDDYPDQCYPVDIAPAIAAIQRADKLLGSDHSKIIQRAIRAFQNEKLDPETGLPAYIADSKTGQGIGPARGVGVSFMLIWVAELWPQEAEVWSQRFNTHFWQSDSFFAGYREFRHGADAEPWFVDVDAGPVILQYGTAASAFGLAASRANGHFDKAYSIGTQALVASWPLLDGTLLNPRQLSNLSDAPYVGEAALLFSFTRLARDAVSSPPEKQLPLSVVFGLVFYALAGLIITLAAAVIIKRFHRNRPNRLYPAARSQLGVWCLLILGGILTAYTVTFIHGLIILLSAQLLPRAKVSR